MMDAAPGAMTHSRMTNGLVSRPTMLLHSRMTNGTLQKGSGTTLVVHYQDGAQTISVPPNVPVTEVAREKVTFAAGNTVMQRLRSYRTGRSRRTESFSSR